MTDFQKNFETAFVNALNSGYVKFKYRKNDGSIREAIGTRNLTSIFRVSDWRPCGGSENNSVICYFDLVEGSWRSLKRGNLIDVHVEEDGAVHFNSNLDFINVSGKLFNMNEKVAMFEAIKMCLNKDYINRVRELAQYAIFEIDDHRDVQSRETYSTKLQDIAEQILSLAGEIHG